MEERNKTIFQMNADNRLYTLSTSLLKDKINLSCTDQNGKIYENSFTLPELLRISRYFQPNHTLEQIQLYLNGIIEKQKIGINQTYQALSINFFLINNDQITIPLLKRIEINYCPEFNENVLNKNLIQPIVTSKNKNLEEENKQLKEKINRMKQNHKDEVNKLKKEIEKLKLDLLKANQVINNDDYEIKKLKEKNMNLENQLNLRENRIKDLENKIYRKPKYDMNDIMVINFISTDSTVIEGIKCLSSDIFAEVEERLYKKYDDLRNTNNMFTANAKPILRFKKLSENNIHDGDKIQLFKLE